MSKLSKTFVFKEAGGKVLQFKTPESSEDRKFNDGLNRARKTIERAIQDAEKILQSIGVDPGDLRNDVMGFVKDFYME